MTRIVNILIASILIFSGCQHDKNNTKTSTQDIDSIQKNTSVVQNQVQTQASEAVIHFWDNLNFHDEKLAISPEYGEQNFVNFINLFPSTDDESISKGIHSLIHKSSVSSKVRLYYEELLNRYLYDVNSPFYNESYYIIALKVLIASEDVTQTHKTKYNTLLKIANQNRVGTKATDFTFYANGKTQTLYNLQKDFIILFFYEPTCSSCKESIAILRNSDKINLALNDKAMILALYPDGNKDIWEKNSSNIPSTWTNGIDLEQKILKKGLYDLKASPTIYLIDKSKNVILKDTSIDQILHYFNSL